MLVLCVSLSYVSGRPGPHEELRLCFFQLRAHPQLFRGQSGLAPLDASDPPLDASGEHCRQCREVSFGAML